MKSALSSRKVTDGSESLDNSALATCLPGLPLIASSSEDLVTCVQKKTTCNL